MHTGPLDSPAAAHKAVRGMIARTLRDPYTKFISPKVRVCIRSLKFLCSFTILAFYPEGGASHFEAVHARHRTLMT